MLAVYFENQNCEDRRENQAHNDGNRQGLNFSALFIRQRVRKKQLAQCFHTSMLASEISLRKTPASTSKNDSA
ncbi:MAG: hypothetical protein WCS42_26970, partial [Verrucomicrobiota bacterium]